MVVAEEEYATAATSSLSNLQKVVHIGVRVQTLDNLLRVIVVLAKSFLEYLVLEKVELHSLSHIELLQVSPNVCQCSLELNLVIGVDHRLSEIKFSLSQTHDQAGSRVSLLVIGCKFLTFNA